jgi:hypothetical protein
MKNSSILKHATFTVEFSLVNNPIHLTTLYLKNMILSKLNLITTSPTNSSNLTQSIPVLALIQGIEGLASNFKIFWPGWYSKYRRQNVIN